MIKKFFLVILFFLPLVAFATNIYTVPETLFDKIGRCQFDIFCYFEQSFGTTITTISGSDQITNSRTVINTNFANLNSGKIENSTSSIQAITTLSNLTTTGTITSGTWNGTTVAVAYGGTGSSTPTGLLWGDGAGVYKSVNSGTNGQFLTSTGPGTVPNYTTSAVDQSLSYNWTGTVFNVKNLNASSTTANPLILNNVSYSLPATQGASSTALLNDGTGKLSWNPYDWIELGSVIATTTSSLSLTFASSSQIQVQLLVPQPFGSAASFFLTFNASTTGYYGTLYKNYGLGTAVANNSDINAAKLAIMDTNGTTSPFFMTMDIQNLSSGPKMFKYTTTVNNGNSVQSYGGVGFWNNGNLNITSVNIFGTNPVNFPVGSKLTVFGTRD